MKEATAPRFIKKVSGDELSFLTADGEKLYLSFNLPALREMVLAHGEIETALAVCRGLEAAVGFRLTPEEIEHAVDDI